MKVALLSDIHANLTALEAVLTSLGPVDAIWAMGDTVGYGPDPSDTLALVRERGVLLVAGNHDRAVATGHGLEHFNKAAADAARLHAAWLSPAERDALAALDEVVVEGGFSLCHGSFRDPLWEYAFTAQIAGASLARASTPHGCCGHTHVPVLWRDSGGALQGVRPIEGEPMPLGERALVNPGSVGQPRDGDARASYAVLDDAAMTVTFRRAAYDAAAVRTRIHRLGLPEVLGDRLIHGL